MNIAIMLGLAFAATILGTGLELITPGIAVAIYILLIALAGATSVYQVNGAAIARS